MTREATAPADILSFSFVVWGRIQRLSWRPLSLDVTLVDLDADTAANDCAHRPDGLRPAEAALE